MSSNSPQKQMILSALGLALLIVGVSCILLWWDDLVTVVRGVIGFILAVSGLFVLYTLKN